MFYLNSIEQLENLVGLKEQLEVCLTCSRLLAAIQMLLLHQKLRCDSNKTTLLSYAEEELKTNSLALGSDD